MRKLKIAVVRVRGVKNVRGDIARALGQLRLTRKNHCVVFESPGELPKWLYEALQKTRDYVTWGELSAEASRLLSEKKKPEFATQKNGFKESLFRMNNPRGGWIGVKNHFPKGDLGNRGDKISGLIEKMLH